MGGRGVLTKSRERRKKRVRLNRRGFIVKKVAAARAEDGRAGAGSDVVGALPAAGGDGDEFSVM